MSKTVYDNYHDKYYYTLSDEVYRNISPQHGYPLKVRILIDSNVKQIEYKDAISVHDADCSKFRFIHLVSLDVLEYEYSDIIDEIGLYE